MSRAEQGLRANLEYNNGVKANTAFYDELKNKLPNFFTADKLDEFGAVKELGSFDLEKFKASLSENNINELTSGYQLDFIGKNYAKKQAGERPTTVIVPDNVHNEKAENKSNKNLFFSGDNLEVLRHLQQNYANSIDFIYIDPPYNTGSDGFVYPDNFEYSDEQLQDMFGLNIEELKRLKSIQGKASHSAWLTFMYPRLYLAKKLLKDTGVIFVSIDDNEQANLKLLMDDVFGESGFAGEYIWKRTDTPANLSKKIKQSTEYILAYQRKFIEKFSGIKKNSNSNNGLMNQTNSFHKLKFPRNIVDTGLSDGIYEKGSYGTKSYKINLLKDTEVRKGLFIKEVYLEGKFKWTQENLENEIQSGTKISIRTKTFSPSYEKSEYDAETPPSLIDRSVNVGTNEEAQNYLFDMFGQQSLFTNPKPTSLIKYLLGFVLNKNAVIFDFFAGSSTTADAVMQLNAEDGGHRQFMMCTLPEPTFSTNSNGKEVPTKGGEAAYKAGFKSIDEISRERIIRASANIKAENTNLSEDFDGGFKHYRVVPAKQETLDQLEFDDNLQLDMFDNMLDDFSSDHLGVTGQASGFDTILQTYLASDNYQFDVPMKMIDFGGIKVAYVNQQRIYIITDNWQSENTKALVNAIGTNQLAVQTIVVFGYPMAMESLRELKIALKQLENNVKVLVRY
ncbi:DNA methyltransferase [Latilactobacillus curvatus]|uniref:site-specific DNA-methyltransferase n=1 Tax=Latilactobacillus curvatus TaxID=28038 RepID=UPI0038899C40